MDRNQPGMQQIEVCKTLKERLSTNTFYSIGTVLQAYMPPSARACPGLIREMMLVHHRYSPTIYEHSPF